MVLRRGIVPVRALASWLIFGGVGLIALGLHLAWEYLEDRGRALLHRRQARR